MTKQKITRLTLDDAKEWEVPNGWRVVSMQTVANETGRSVYVVIEQVQAEPNAGRW